MLMYFVDKLLYSFWKHLCAMEYHAFGQQISMGNKFERQLEDTCARMLNIINL